MSLLQLERISVGSVGVKPGTVAMVSTENLAAVTTAGYIPYGTDSKAWMIGLSQSDVINALIDFNEVSGAGTYVILIPTIASGEITLSAWDSPGTQPLTQNHILVGNATNVATDVAMSGDATIVASGALTIANDAITTAKILNANVTLAKLATGVAPSHIIKFANQVTTVGGAAAEAFTVTGAVAATDRAFVQIVDNGTNNVTALQAVVTADTLTVTFSADPGADCVLNYQIIRAVS